MDTINALGRRKTAIARIYLTSGPGEIKVNKRPLDSYFPSKVLQMVVQQPLHEVEVAQQYNIQANIHGGGLKGQAEALRLAIARALCQVEAAHRPRLKQAGYLTRDPRMVERKKYGQRKARKRFQFSKR
ncbi:MAG: 30S ribosomal protein S9 [Bacteroidota bacterium]